LKAEHWVETMDVTTADEKAARRVSRMVAPMGD
jgi:hypothetical protein